jgi:hypothetical protein
VFNTIKKGNTTTFVQSPYESIRPYSERIIDKVTYEGEEVDVADYALSKNQRKKRTIVAEPDVVESWAT